MRNVVDIKRYIDDGIGVHLMTKRAFETWKKVVSTNVSACGLKIKHSDWNFPDHHNGSVNFLDVKFWFNQEDLVLYRLIFIKNPQMLVTTYTSPVALSPQPCILRHCIWTVPALEEYNQW